MGLVPRHIFLPVWKRCAILLHEVIAVEKLVMIFRKNRSMILYLLFGFLTTAVNYIVYFPLYYWAEQTATISNICAWIAAALFAFITNKSLVFSSKSWSFRVLLKEIFAFFSCRLLTGVMETLALFVFVDYLGMNSIIWKIAISFVVVIINYIGSKLFVFRQK